MKKTGLMILAMILSIFFVSCGKNFEVEENVIEVEENVIEEENVKKSIVPAVIDPSYGVICEVPEGWIREELMSDDKQELFDYVSSPDDELFGTLYVGLYKFNGNIIYSEEEAEKFLTENFLDKWYSEKEIEYIPYEISSFPAKHLRYIDSEGVTVDEYWYCYSYDRVLLLRFYSFMIDAIDFEEEYYAELYDDIIESIVLPNSFTAYSKSSDSKSNDSNDGCQFKYSDGSVCGSSTGKYDPLCDKHFNQLDDTYNSYTQ